MKRYTNSDRWTIAILLIATVAALWWAFTPSDVYINGCKYIHVYHAMTHAGDCPNPIHATPKGTP